LKSGQTESYAALAMTRQERKVLGMALSGEIMQRDVVQTTVSFVNHRVGLPAATEAETREELRYLALNFLVTQVLERIQSLRTQRHNFEEQQQILQIKLRIPQSKQRGLESLAPESDELEVQTRSLQQKIAENRKNLQEVKVQLDELNDYIDHLNAVLGNPEEYLTVNKISMKLNRLGVKLEEDSAEHGSTITLAGSISPF
jgi:chromosome segregation ATPase